MTTAPSDTQFVHLVDDDESLRTAVGRLLHTAGFNVRSYASAAEFLLAREGLLRGCIVLDVRMPGGPSGLELQKGLIRQAEMVPVIFLTGHGDIPMSVQAIKSGAFDFLTKPVPKEVLLATIEAALEKDASDWEKTERKRELMRRESSLTTTERKIYQCVVAGQPNKQITLEIGAAERTVKAHRAQVMNKMGAASLADLVQMAEQLRSFN